MNNNLYYVVVNQGYHLDTNPGCYNTNDRIGPVERAELHRAEMIDFGVQEKQKLERRKRDDEDSW